MAFTGDAPLNDQAAIDVAVTETGVEVLTLSAGESPEL